jgi:4-diphosphocytidyl-2-C-methyl-D-erythritol kinase
MIELKSFAKINLGLEITGKRPDGYHNLKTIFQTINFFDTIEIKENNTGKINLSGSDPSIEWNNHNTIFKAFDSLYKKFNLHQGFDIFVKKNIPPGSGLGGGSSNAAVTLLFLINYFDLDIPAEELIRIAAEIGADVPFFLIGGTVLAEGIGEKMTPMDDIKEKFVDIVIPPVSVSTKLIFSHFNLTSITRTSKINTFINSKSINILENNLENVTFELFPEVGIIKKKMRKLGYELVLMSGSGSSIYGMVDAPKKQELSAWKKENRLSRVINDFPGSIPVSTHTIGRKNYWKSIGASPSGKASVFGADTRRFESSRPSY